MREGKEREKGREGKKEGKGREGENLVFLLHSKSAAWLDFTSTHSAAKQRLWAWGSQWQSSNIMQGDCAVWEKICTEEQGLVENAPHRKCCVSVYNACLCSVAIIILIWISFLVIYFISLVILINITVRRLSTNRHKTPVFVFWSEWKSHLKVPQTLYLTKFTSISVLSGSGKHELNFEQSPVGIHRVLILKSMLAHTYSYKVPITWNCAQNKMVGFALFKVVLILSS